MSGYGRLLIACLLLACPALALAQSLNGLRQAVGADEATWSRAVKYTVTTLKETTPMTNGVVWALAKVMAVETLRPAESGSLAPDAATAQRIGDLLTQAEGYLAPPDPMRPPLPVPPLPPPAGTTGNRALAALRQGPTPHAAKALIDIGTASPAVFPSVVMVLMGAPYPEFVPLAEKALSEHCGGDTEATLIDRVASGQITLRYSEAAILLFLLRPDNFANVQARLLRSEAVAGRRLLHVLPRILISGTDESLAQQAALTLADRSQLTVPGGTEWTLTRKVALYRAWRDLSPERKALPPLLAPDWDRDDPIVAALQSEYEAQGRANPAQALSNVGGAPKARQAALRALIFENTEATWQTILAHLERETDWSVLGYVLSLTGTCAPERVPTLHDSLVRRLRLEGEAGRRQLALALIDAREREGVTAVAAIAGDIDRPWFCSLFQDLARGQNEPLKWQTPSFAAIRNSITAYGQLDRDGAVAFYRPLLASERPRQREVAVYALGELKVAEAIPELLAVLRPDTEDCMVAGSVCVALGKMGTAAAHEALIGLLSHPNVTDSMAWSIAVVMNSICGQPGRGPTGTWENGTWWTEADIPRVAAARFAPALLAYADRTQDERTARELRGRAGVAGASRTERGTD